MDTSQIQRYILNRLSASAERDDIIREVCLRFGLDWQAAEALVQTVEEANAPVIYRRQSPILITTLLIDALLGGYIVAAAVSGLFLPAIQNGTVSWAELFHILQFGRLMAILLLIGMAMLLGGLTGLVGVLYHLIRNDGPLDED